MKYIIYKTEEYEQGKHLLPESFKLEIEAESLEDLEKQIKKKKLTDIKVVDKSTGYIIN